MSLRKYITSSREPDRRWDEIGRPSVLVATLPTGEGHMEGFGFTQKYRLKLTVQNEFYANAVMLRDAENTALQELHWTIYADLIPHIRRAMKCLYAGDREGVAQALCSLEDEMQL